MARRLAVAAMPQCKHLLLLYLYFCWKQSVRAPGRQRRTAPSKPGPLPCPKPAPYLGSLVHSRLTTRSMSPRHSPSAVSMNMGECQTLLLLIVCRRHVADNTARRC